MRDQWLWLSLILSRTLLTHLRKIIHNTCLFSLTGCRMCWVWADLLSKPRFPPLHSFPLSKLVLCKFENRLIKSCGLSFILGKGKKTKQNITSPFACCSDKFVQPETKHDSTRMWNSSIVFPTKKCCRKRKKSILSGSTAPRYPEYVFTARRTDETTNN